MAYKIGEYGKAQKDFSDCFGISIGHFYDGLVTVVFNEVKIDLVKFDDYMLRKHGDYIQKGISLENLILREYGKRGVELLNELL